MWMICLFAAGYRVSSSLALKFQLLTSRSCFGNGGACIVDLIIHYWPDMVIEKHYKPRSYSTIFHRWWRWSLFILLAYRWKEPFDLNVKLWYQPPDDYIDFRRNCGVICDAESMRFAQALSTQIAGWPQFHHRQAWKQRRLHFAKVLETMLFGIETTKNKRKLL